MTKVFWPFCVTISKMNCFSIFPQTSLDNRLFRLNAKELTGLILITDSWRTMSNSPIKLGRCKLNVPETSPLIEKMCPRMAVLVDNLKHRSNLQSRLNYQHPLSKSSLGRPLGSLYKVRIFYLLPGSKESQRLIHDSNPSLSYPPNGSSFNNHAETKNHYLYER